MLQFSKIKFDGQTVSLAWFDSLGVPNSYGPCADEPHPDFVEKFNRMETHIRQICLLEDDEQAIEVRGLTIKREQGVTSATITGLRDLGELAPAMVINTPHGSEWLSHDFHVDLVDLEAEAEAYIRHKRKQLDMFEQDQGVAEAVADFRDTMQGTVDDPDSGIDSIEFSTGDGEHLASFSRREGSGALP